MNLDERRARANALDAWGRRVRGLEILAHQALTDLDPDPLIAGEWLLDWSARREFAYRLDALCAERAAFDHVRLFFAFHLSAPGRRHAPPFLHC